MERYIVITEDGFEMWAPMDRDVAEELASEPTPNGTRQYAVPERVAAVIKTARDEMTAAAARRLAEDRITRTRQLLSAFDDTKHLVA